MKSWKSELALYSISASLVAATALILACVTANYVLIWRHEKCQKPRVLSSNTMERNIEELITLHGSLTPKIYKYSEVIFIKITSYLRYKLGQGGYGTVFKGRLPDSRLVAVKFLHDSKGKGEESVNEVMTIGRTSHVNIVSLRAGSKISRAPERTRLYGPFRLNIFYFVIRYRR